MLSLRDRPAGSSKTEAQVCGSPCVLNVWLSPCRDVFVSPAWCRLQCCGGGELDRIGSEHTDPVTRQPALISQFFYQSAVSSRSLPPIIAEQLPSLTVSVPR